MRQFVTIAGNAFMELTRQPVYLILLAATPSFEIFLSSIFYFGFGDDPKLVKGTVLALMFFTGLLGAVLTASSSLSRELRTGTALAVLSKPVSRFQFLTAKFAGLAAALALLMFANLLAALLASRMAFDAYGGADVRAILIFYGFLVAGLVVAGFSNFFLRRPFVSDAVFAITGFMILAFVLINFIDKEGKWQAFGSGVDWIMAPASLLILFAVWVLAGLALACSTRLDMIPTLGLCSAIFLLGLMSDYLFGQAAERGAWWGTVLYSLVPNWQLFWLADAIENQKSIPWTYIGRAFAYSAFYLGAVLAAAQALFQERELS